MAPSIDVVITAYGRYDLTRSCLEHLAGQTVAHNVIVVVNGSVEDEAASIQEDFPSCEVVELESNHGFAEATNLGVAAGKSEIIVLLNNDVDCDRTFLEELARPFAEDRKVGSSVPLLLRPGRGEVDSFGLAADPTLACFPRHQGLDPATSGRCRLALAAAAGAGAAYRRSAWEEVGGLDENLPAYMEDFDLGLQLRAAGWECRLAPNAVAVHVGSATFGARPESQRWKAGFGRGYMLRRYGVMEGLRGLRAGLTELIIVCGDALANRDTAAFRGRLSGWRAAAGLRRKPVPTSEFVDEEIGFFTSLQLRARRPGKPRDPFG